MEKVRTELASELVLLGASNAILSTNIELRLDGQPFSNRRQPDDKGAAVYFKLKGKDVSLACDRWDRVEDNIWAVTKHINSLRGQDRWGVGSIEQAFRGYTALPASTGGDWWAVLGIAVNASRDQALSAYREKARAHHPDTGDGDTVSFQRAQTAWEQFQKANQ